LKLEFKLDINLFSAWGTLEIQEKPLVEKEEGFQKEKNLRMTQ
jgi:hypothetical protein